VTVTLRLRFKEAPAAKVIAVTLNGAPLTAETQDGPWLEFPVEPALVKQGDNVFALGVAAGEPTRPVLLDLLLRVRH
jgi:hypothetical protein